MSFETGKIHLRRALRRLDLALFSVSAILVLDGLTAVASIGFPSFTWTVFFFLVFFIPYGLITAELGAAYPTEGGMFAWVQKAFGERWAVRSTWCYWVCVPLGMPSVYVLFAGVLSHLFLPGLSMGWVMAIAIGMTWLTVLAQVLRLEVAKWMPNLGATVKAVIFLALGIAGLSFALRVGSANRLVLRSLLPGWDAGLGFLPVIVFNFLGFELASAAGEEIKDPQHDVLVAIISSGILIALFYLFANLGILLVVPLDRLSLLGGIIDTLSTVLGHSGAGQMVVSGLGIGFLFTLFATMVTWLMGTGRMACEASARGRLPAIFGWRHPKHGSPIGASLLAGAISTLVLVIYGILSGKDEELFWSLFSFASIVFLLPYLLLFPAYLKLRYADPQTRRPYRLAGGLGTAWLASIICTLVILLAIVFFVWVPGLPLDQSFALPVLVGVGITLVVGEVLLQLSSRFLSGRLPPG